MVMSNITVEGIDPDCKILGADQKFIYGSTDAIVKLRAYSQFTPTVPNDSVIDEESRNVNLSGFRWRHTTKTTDISNYGRLKLQSFINDGTGTDILEYDQTSLNLSVPVVSSQLTYGRKSSGCIYFDTNTTDTAPLTAATWTKVLGTTTAATSNTSDITMPSNNRITYTPVVSGTSSTFSMTASISCQNRASTAGILWFGLYKNGTTLIGTPSKTTLVASSTNNFNTVVQVQDTLASGDYVELWCLNTLASTGGIRVTDASILLAAL
jgi:hypothetical protein